MATQSKSADAMKASPNGDALLRRDVRALVTQIARLTEVVSEFAVRNREGVERPQEPAARPDAPPAVPSDGADVDALRYDLLVGILSRHHPATTSAAPVVVAAERDDDTMYFTFSAAQRDLQPDNVSYGVVGEATRRPPVDLTVYEADKDTRVRRASCRVHTSEALTDIRLHTGTRLVAISADLPASSTYDRS